MFTKRKTFILRFLETGGNVLFGNTKIRTVRYLLSYGLSDTERVGDLCEEFQNV